MKRKSLGILSAVVLGTIALATTPCLYAQSKTVAPAQVFDGMLSSVEHEVVSLVEAMPADKFNFAPTNGNFKGVRTFGEQVQHLTEANYHIYGAMGLMPAPTMPKASEMKTKAQIVQALKDSFAYAHQSIAKLTPQNSFEAVGRGQINRIGLAAYGMIHMNDHFGQMVEYLRMNGIVPPSSQPQHKMPAHK